MEEGIGHGFVTLGVFSIFVQFNKSSYVKRKIFK